MAQWTITDFSTGAPVEWAFPINPNTFEHPGRSATFVEEATVGSVGGTIIFQGRDSVPILSFTGVVTSQQFYEDLRAQLDKWYDLLLTDDQGNSWTVIVQTYSFTRKKSAINHHRYDYNVTCKVLG